MNSPRRAVINTYFSHSLYDNEGDNRRASEGWGDPTTLPLSPSLLAPLSVGPKGKEDGGRQREDRGTK